MTPAIAPASPPAFAPAFAPALASASTAAPSLSPAATDITPAQALSPTPAQDPPRGSARESLALPQTSSAAPTEPTPPGTQGQAQATRDSGPTLEPDYKAAYLNNPHPPYPRNAYRFGIEGKVVLQADVNEEGVPIRVRVVQSSGNELLDDSALSTVAKWRFSPARKDGLKVSAVVKIPIAFSLKASALR